jgi:hypothetical protein
LKPKFGVSKKRLFILTPIGPLKKYKSRANAHPYHTVP